MPYEVEETGNLTRTATVSVPYEKYEKKVNKELKALAGKVKIRGFRKGKIPLAMMKKRYGPAVTRDVVEELVSESVSEILEEVGSVLFVGTPQVTNIPVEEAGPLEFTVDLELRPELDPIGFLGMEVEKPKVELEDDAIDKELEKLQEQHATTEPVVLRETIATGDIVTVDFQAVGDHPELEAMKGDDVQIEVGGGQALPGIDEALQGAAFDAVVESEIEVGEDFPVEEFRGGNVPIRLTVKKVERRVVPELSDDFAQQTGEGETLLEVRGKIRERLVEAREKQAREFAANNMMERLLEQNSFELPPQFLDDQVRRAAEQRLQMFRQQGLDPDQFGLTADALIDDMREGVATQIKEELLLMEIARKENIKVEEDDLKTFFEETAAQMGVNVQQYLGFMRQNPNMMRQAQATALLEKVRNHLLNEATIKEVEWPEEEEDPALAAATEQESAEEESAEKTGSEDESAEESASDEDSDKEDSK